MSQYRDIDYEIEDEDTSSCTSLPEDNGINPLDLSYQPSEQVDTYFPFSWTKRAWFLHKNLIADGLDGGVFWVLYTISARLAQETKPGTLTIFGTCFPSIDTIAAEAGVSTSTAKRAIRELKAAGYLLIQKIPAAHLSSRRFSRWNCNRYAIGPKWDAAHCKTGSTAPKPPSAQTTSVLDSSEDLLVSAPAPVAIQADDAPEFKAESPEHKAACDEVFGHLQVQYGQHPTMLDKGAQRLVAGCIEGMLDAVDGDVSAIFEVLGHLPQKKIMDCKKLGGYLLKVFLDVMPEFKKRQDSEYQTLLEKARDTGREFVQCPNIHRAKGFISWMRVHAGDDLTYISGLREEGEGYIEDSDSSFVGFMINQTSPGDDIDDDDESAATTAPSEEALDEVDYYAKAPVSPAINQRMTERLKRDLEAA
jgi:hypothetical protein